MKNVKHVSIILLVLLFFSTFQVLGKEKDEELWFQEKQLFFIACMFSGYKSLNIERVDTSLIDELSKLQSNQTMVKRVLAHAAEYVESYMIERKKMENDVPLGKNRLVMFICYDKYVDKSLKKLLRTPIKKEFIQMEKD